MSQNKYHMSVFKVIENRFLPVSMAHFCRQSGSSSNHFLGDVSFRPNQAKIFIIHKSNIRHALPEVFKQTPPDSGHSFRPNQAKIFIIHKSTSDMLCLKSSNRLHLTQATGLVTVPQRPSHCYGVRSLFPRL